MSTEQDEAGFRALLAQVARDRGFPCANYKDGCLRRRIAVRMRACGIASYAAYAEHLRRDAGEYDRLVDVLTINVTRLYRDAEVWQYLGDVVLPALWRRAAAARFVAWSAACSSGEELYTIAALLHREAVRTQTQAQLARARVIGTDIDEPSLAAARRATYAETSFTEMPVELRDRYFPALGGKGDLGGAEQRMAAPELRTLVQVERRDLLQESVPVSGVHLITCRNVLIYFERESQEPLLRRFHDALVPGGILVLGKVETLLGPARALFEVVDQRQRVFRRRDAA